LTSSTKLPKKMDKPEAFKLQDLDGTWVCPKGVFHHIHRAVLSSEGFLPRPFRADRADKHGLNHFSVGHRRRKGSAPSTLMRCQLRSRCYLLWTSPRYKEQWERHTPFIAGCLEALFIGPDGTEVRADVAKATNVCHLRLEACKSSCLRKSGIVGVMSSDELSFTEVATGKILTDSCDLSSSKDVKLRVSTCLSDMILAGRLRLIYADGRACEADVKHAYHLRQIFDCVAKHTSRPPEFVRIFAGCKQGMVQLRYTQPWICGPDDEVVLEVHLRETIAELWSSQRLSLLRDGQDWHVDLSKTWTLEQVREVLARETLRPSRFVRFASEDLYHKAWNLDIGESMNLEVQICPTVAELMNQSGVKIVNCMTGDEIELVAKEASCLESIQDLREHIARCRKLRATAVTLLANDKPLWDGDLYDLCAISAGSTIGVCLRDPKLCEQGQHEELVFFNNGYIDKVCIHCGPEWLMERRTLEPARVWRQ